MSSPSPEDSDTANAAVGPVDPATVVAADEPAAATSAPAPPQTGDAHVDAAVSELAGLSRLPVHEHAPRFDAVHVSLQGTLARLDES